jgi:tetratricopeptide (TPR) repeat protein
LVSILAITVAAYYQIINCGFISFDDSVYVIDNDMIKVGFSFESIRWAFTTQTDGNWFPLTWISYILDTTIAGSSPRTYHVFNLIYHLINSSLLFAALYALTGNVNRSAIVMGLFALHPLHVESVAWISERKDLLSLFFFFLTVISYAKYRKHQCASKYLITILLFACGLMSKSMLVSTPLLFLLLDYWPLGKYKSIFSKEFGSLLIEKIPFFFLSLLSGIITYNVQKHKAVVSFVESSLLINVKNALVSYCSYIYKTFVPINLSVIYTFPNEIPFLKVVTSISFLVIVSIMVLRRKERPYLMVGWYWYLVSLLPVIGIIRVGKQSMADRYTYLPHIGLFVLLVWGISELRFVSKVSRRTNIAIVMCVFIVMSTITWNQVSKWKTSISLFNHAISVTDNNWVALGVLGYDYLTNNELDKAFVFLNKSLSVNPKNVMALYNMGILQNKLRNRDYALELFNKIITIEPDYRMAYYQIGLQLLFRGDVAGALQQHNILKELDDGLAKQLLGLIRIQINSVATIAH